MDEKRSQIIVCGLEPFGELADLPRPLVQLDRPPRKGPGGRRLVGERVTIVAHGAGVRVALALLEHPADAANVDAVLLSQPLPGGASLGPLLAFARQAAGLEPGGGLLALWAGYHAPVHARQVHPYDVAHSLFCKVRDEHPDPAGAPLHPMRPEHLRAWTQGEILCDPEGRHSWSQPAGVELHAVGGLVAVVDMTTPEDQGPEAYAKQYGAAALVRALLIPRLGSDWPEARAERAAAPAPPKRGRGKARGPMEASVEQLELKTSAALEVAEDLGAGLARGVRHGTHLAHRARDLFGRVRVALQGR